MKVPVKEEDKIKSYYKYFEMPLAEQPRDKLKKLSEGQGNPADALKIENRNKLFDKGDLSDEFGFYMMDDGSAIVSNNTLMPGVTGEMLAWWFAWHPLDPLRYAIWDNEDHFDAEVDPASRAKILDPTVPLREKSWGVTHKVLEAMGGPATPITIMFQYPKDMGFEQDKIGTDACSFMVCANGLIEMPDGNKAPSVMTHMARDVEGGVEFRTRFWMGYHIIEGKPVKLIPPGFNIPKAISEALLAHNIKEYANLAAILPNVYAEEKDNW